MVTSKIVDFRSDVFDMWDHMEWSYGKHRGYAILGLWNQDTENMHQIPFQWPNQKEELFKYLEESKNLEWTEIFYCPLLRQTSRRDLGNASHRDIIWTDVDGNLKESTMSMLRAWGARIISSGSPGSYHIYFKLTQNLSSEQHRNLENALRNLVGGDNKIADNDFLKLPGSWNYKNHKKFKDTGKMLYQPVLSSILDVGIVVDDIFNKLSVSLSKNVKIETSAEYEKVAIPTKIPDYVRSLMAEKSEGDGSGRFRRCWNAVRTVAECVDHKGNQRFTLAQCHAILDKYDPGVDKFGSRSGGWHAQINKIWKEWESEHSLVTIDKAIEDLLWNRRESLQHIHTCSLLGRVSPWSVLGVVLARVVARIPYNVVFPGHKTKSLNLSVALVGDSGSGKGAATSVAEKCVDLGTVETVELGTGAGLVTAYKAYDKKTDTHKWVKRSMLFMAPEVGVWAARISRVEDPLIYWLSQAWSGESIGGKLKTTDLDIRLEPNTYRLCLVMGVQPGMADSLLKNKLNGAPQRFLWLPAEQYPGKTEDLPPPLIWPNPEWPFSEKVWGRTKTWNYEIPFPEIVEDDIDEWMNNRIHRRLAGLKNDPYTSHEMLLRRKVCVALMALDGRIEANEEDWKLAGYIVDQSNQRRKKVQRELREIVIENNKDSGWTRGVSRSHEKLAEQVTDRKLELDAKNRIAKRIVERVRSVPGISMGKLRVAVNQNHRHLFDDVLKRLVSKGIVRTQNVVYKGAHTKKFFYVEKADRRVDEG